MQDVYGDLMDSDTVSRDPYLLRLHQMFGPFIGDHNLNIGCAGNKMPGFINLDKDHRVHPDICADVSQGLPHIKDNTYDTILASHVLEHIPRDSLFHAFNEFHRILKPRGFLIAITPYGSADGAWDNPHHHTLFTETTYEYFTKRLYEIEHAGYKAYEGHTYREWEMAEKRLIPYPEFAKDPELEFKAKHWRNVIQELQVIMRAVKEVKEG